MDGHQGGEGLLTVGAFAAPYGTVGVLLFGVGSEIGWLGETVAAKGALERLLTSVNHHVMEQGLSGDQTGSLTIFFGFLLFLSKVKTIYVNHTM